MELEYSLKKYYAFCNEIDIDDFNKILDDSKYEPLYKTIELIRLDIFKYHIDGDMVLRLIQAKDIRNYYAHQVFLDNPIRRHYAKPEFASKIEEDIQFIDSLLQKISILYDRKREEKDNGK